jgi:DNA replication and repair protein RecF
VRSVWVKSIQLTGFRNYDSESVALDSGLNLFLGRNAQGKTNLLEAVYVASAGRSYRASSDSELVRRGGTFYRIVADVQRRPTPVKLEVSYSTDGRKLVRLNGTERIRAAELSSFLNVVMFTPDDLALVKGSPSVRRRFLDMEISQVSPAYRQWTSTYAKVVSQRNALLKQAKGRGMQSNSAAIDRLLEVWDRQLVDTGSKITVRRREVVASLDELGRDAHQRITGESSALSIRYLPSVPIAPEDVGPRSGSIPRAGQSMFEGSASRKSPPAGDSAVDKRATVDWIADRYRARLKQMRRVELIRGVTMVGPHRDDIGFQLDGVDIATYGSQGQQRSAVLAVKLAEAHFIRAHTGEMPVLLLDDVLSELDERRRTNLLREVIGRTQVLVTSVEPGCRDLMPEGARVFTIAAGEVTPDDVAPQRCSGEEHGQDGIYGPDKGGIGHAGVE